MENFVVSARKYRPTSFDAVVGQGHITTTLQNAIKSGHLAQAFLFCGPRGVGKTTCARILAKTINCLDISETGDACDSCDSCNSFNDHASLNIHELDAASNNSVEDIRNLVDQVRYPPQSGKYKIYIIDEVHMLSNSAFNAFLKTLEEPPAYAIFILATTEKHKIIPTILSRCQIFDFNRIQIKDISQHLAKIANNEEVTAELEALHLIAEKADGGLRDALSMFDLLVTFASDNAITYQNTIENLHILDYDYYFKIVDALNEENLSTTLLLFDEILKKGFDGHQFIIGLSEHLRNLLVSKDPETTSLLQIPASAKEKYAQQAKQISMSFLVTSLNILSKCDINYKLSKNHRLLVEIALIKMAHIKRAVSFSQAASEMSSDAKKKSLDVKKNVQTLKESVHKAGFKKTPPIKISPEVKAPLTEEKLQDLGQDLNNAISQKKQPKNDSQQGLLDSFENETPQIPVLRHLSNNEVENALQTLTTTLPDNLSSIFKSFKLDGDIITLELPNDYLLDKLDKSKATWVKTLREILNHPKANLNGVVNATIEKSNKPYTVSEKLNFLKEKNPALEQLQRVLELYAG